jgi:hypothetical protein
VGAIRSAVVDLVFEDGAAPLLADDRIDRDRRLARGAIGDDKLALSAAVRKQPINHQHARLDQLGQQRALDAAKRLLNSTGAQPTELLVLGGRGLAAAEERGLKVGWSASMIARVEEAAALADWVAEQLYDRLERGRAPGLASPTRRRRRRLTFTSSSTCSPFDFTRFSRARTPSPPLILPPPSL